MFNLPNLFSDIFNKTLAFFHQAEAVVDNTYAGLVKVMPSVEHVVSAEASAMKQQVSNAFNWVDTEVAAHYADGVSMVESACDTLLVRVTGGVALPAVPLVNTAIEDGFAILRAVIDHKEAAAKAAMSLPPATSAAQPTLAGVATAAVTAAASGAIAAEHAAA